MICRKKQIFPDVHSVGISGGLGLLTYSTYNMSCMFLEFVRLVSPPQTSLFYN